MTSTEKLVELLRATLPMKAVGRGRHGDTIVEVDLTAIEHQRHEAADALEAKDARIAELEAALEPFVRADRALGREPGPYRFETGNGHVNLDREDFRRAASARGREDQQ